MVFDYMVKKSIKDVILEISKNPLIYFSEKRLQVRLASKLSSYSELSKPIQTSLYKQYKKNIEKLGSEESYLDKSLSIAPLQMEYGINETGSYRLDIAILDPEGIKLIDNWQFKIGQKNLDPLIAIEIGTEKSGVKNMCNHLENDAKKLKNYKKSYILNVIRNTNVCGKQTKDYKNKELQLDKFKKFLKTVLSSPKYAQINCIGLIIHIAYQELEFFGNNEWKRFNILSEDEEFEKAVTEKLCSS